MAAAPIASKLNTLPFVGNEQVVDVMRVKDFGNWPRVMPFVAPTLNAACLGVECGRRKRKKQCDSYRSTLHGVKFMWRKLKWGDLM